MSTASMHRLNAARLMDRRFGSPLDPARGIVIGCAISIGMWMTLLTLIVA